MKRRIAFIMFGVFVATLFAVALTPVSYGQEIKLTYANFPPAPTFPCVQMERWAKEVEQRTKGNVKVQTFPGGTLLAAKNIFDGVMSGTADIGNFAMSYQPGRFPVSEAIDLPLGFSNAKAASLTLYELIEKYKPKEFEGVKILTLFTCPPANIMTRTPVKSLAVSRGWSSEWEGPRRTSSSALAGSRSPCLEIIINLIIYICSKSSYFIIMIRSYSTNSRHNMERDSRFFIMTT